jgi:Tol biopolymer transport system component
MRIPAVIALLVAIVSSQPPAPPAPPAPPSPPPSTDIFILPLAGGLGSLKQVAPLPASTAPGYDNQPMFSADGQRLLFAANRDGRQIDVFLFERKTSRIAQLTDTPENENSPTWLPAGIGDPGGFSVVRTEADKAQRLWRFDARGRNPQLVLTDVKPVGYHAWIDAQTLALFVLGPPSTLRIATVADGTAVTVTEGIGRSLQRVPRARLVSFVQKEASGEFWIKQIDASSKAIVPLVRAGDGTVERDVAWMPDGRTLLMSAGTKVLSWTRGETAWTEVFDAATHQLGVVSRMAVSPQGDALAIVVAEPKR